MFGGFNIQSSSGTKVALSTCAASGVGNGDVFGVAGDGGRVDCEEGVLALRTARGTGDRASFEYWGVILGGVLVPLAPLVPLVPRGLVVPRVFGGVTDPVAILSTLFPTDSRLLAPVLSIASSSARARGRNDGLEKVEGENCCADTPERRGGSGRQSYG